MASLFIFCAFPVYKLLARPKYLLAPLPRASPLAPAALTTLPLNPHPNPPTSSLLPARLEHTPNAQSISYMNTSPLSILTADSCYLHAYDPPSSSSTSPTITVYLDTRNNVSSAGHANPRIAAAVHTQMTRQVSNSRYLNPEFNEVKARIAKLLPSDTKWKIILTNAGSESNDIALRIARAHIKNTANPAKFSTYTYRLSYHGHSTACLSVSPYKLRKLGHSDSSIYAPPDTTVTWLPTPLKYDGPANPSIPHETHLKSFDEAYTPAPSTLMFECGMSVGGVLIPPKEYVAGVVNKIRADGGVVIYDEVQTCCYRAGDFTLHQSLDYPTPDIVTLGKPLGNGIPISACCVRAEVMEGFDGEGLEYFNTFGGNPASCAASIATLKELALLEKGARKVGALIKLRFEQLKAKYPRVIGDVRGEGMFVGVEFLSLRRDASSYHGGMEMSYMASLLKTYHHILTTIDGEKDSVMVVKPPLTFGVGEAEYFVDCVERCIVDKEVGLLWAAEENGGEALKACGATAT